jgi:hypothetical protein
LSISPVQVMNWPMWRWLFMMTGFWGIFCPMSFSALIPFSNLMASTILLPLISENGSWQKTVPARSRPPWNYCHSPSHMTPWSSSMWGDSSPLSLISSMIASSSSTKFYILIHFNGDLSHIL